MNDETQIFTAIPNDVMAGTMKSETEEDRLAQARNRGITIGMAVVAAVFIVCAVGVAFGAFLTRVLAL
jgi:hypothetical protein